MIRVQQLPADGDNFVDRILQDPFLPVGTPPVSRGIKDDPVIEIATFYFAAHKIHSILHHPPDVIEATRLHHLLGPCDHRLH